MSEQRLDEVKRKRKRQVNYTIDPGIYEKLVELAAETGYSQSVLVSMALEDLIEKRKVGK